MAGDLVLLTGATGMIGYRTLLLLLEKGYDVKAAVRTQASFDRIASLEKTLPYRSRITSVLVPDITVPGAYDEAVKGGVRFVVHVASPLAHPKLAKEDLDEIVVKPAVRGTLGMLESAAKVDSIEKVVITSSLLGIAWPSGGTDNVVNESTRTGLTEGPFDTLAKAYAGSKALAFKATEDFRATRKPRFAINNIFPTYVIGRDDTVTDVADIARGTNTCVMSPLFGKPPPPVPTAGASVHLDDVALLHVLALDPSVADGEDFFASSHPPLGIRWADALDIVKRRFPEAHAAGAFQFDDTKPPGTNRSYVDSAKAQERFGFTFKSFEEQVVSVVEHYLELKEKVAERI